MLGYNIPQCHCKVGAGKGHLVQNNQLLSLIRSKYCLYYSFGCSAPKKLEISVKVSIHRVFANSVRDSQPTCKAGKSTTACRSRPFGFYFLAISQHRSVIVQSLVLAGKKQQRGDVIKDFLKESDLNSKGQTFQKWQWCTNSQIIQAEILLLRSTLPPTASHLSAGRGLLLAQTREDHSTHTRREQHPEHRAARGRVG